MNSALKSLSALAIALLWSLAVMTARGADSIAVARPVRAAYTAEIGSSHLTDTYLSPLKYDGIHVGLNYQRYQAMKFAPERWTMSLTSGLTLDKANNPARNATMWDIDFIIDWGMMRRYRPLSRLTLAVGASTSLRAGALYNARNGNNPVSAKAAWTLNLTGYATSRVMIGRLPVSLTYRPTLPVTGIFFSPDYGELYYEIYLGNHSGLVHPAWWGNYFSLDNLLTADLELGGTFLRLGYHGRIFSSRVNSITTNAFTHAIVIGISGDWISLNPRKSMKAECKMINAMY